MKRLLPLLLPLFFLSGCDTLGKKFENRLTVTLDGQRAFVTSLYGPIGITSELAKADADALRAAFFRGAP